MGAPKGHSTSIRVVCSYLEDQRELVRLTAAESLIALAPRGHEPTILMAQRLLRSRSPTTKAAAIMVLGDVALEDSRGVMDLLEKLSDHKDEGVRTAAMEAAMAICCK